MPNPFEVELLTTQYTTRIELLLQQKVSKLRGLVTTDAYVGKVASPVQQIGPMEFKAPGARYSAINFQFPNYTRRWVSPTDRDCGTLKDEFDQLKTIVNPNAAITEAVVAGANRYFDDLIIGAAFATATIGVDSSAFANETWPATTFLVPDTYDSASSSGMTYGKIVEGRRILEHYQNDLDADSVCLVVGSQQNSDMLKQVEVIDKDFNDKPVVEEGRVRMILGCNVVTSERLLTSSSNTLRNTIMFVRSGMHLGIWRDMTIKIDQRIDLNSQPWQLYAMVSAGATRLQLGKVIQINCADTSGADPTAP